MPTPDCDRRPKDRYVTSGTIGHSRPDTVVTNRAERSFVPPYLGHRGWVGIRLDVGTVDWDEVRELLVESSCLCAPKKLAAAVTP